MGGWFSRHGLVVVVGEDAFILPQAEAALSSEKSNPETRLPVRIWQRFSQ
jgi:hypothetical protein